MNGDRMEFIPPGDILKVISERIDIPNEVLDLPGCEADYFWEPRNQIYRYSAAALTLHEHLLVSEVAGDLHWFVCKSGPLQLAPIPYKGAAIEALGWLRKNADMYGRWLIAYRARPAGHSPALGWRK